MWLLPDPRPNHLMGSTKEPLAQVCEHSRVLYAQSQVLSHPGGGGTPQIKAPSALLYF